MPCKNLKTIENHSNSIHNDIPIENGLTYVYWSEEKRHIHATKTATKLQQQQQVLRIQHRISSAGITAIDPKLPAMSTLVACLPTHVLLREFPNADFGCGHLFINSPTTVGATVLHTAHPSNRTTELYCCLESTYWLGTRVARTTRCEAARVAGAPTRAHRDISEKSWGKLSQFSAE